MRQICLVFWESEPQYAYKRYACKKKYVPNLLLSRVTPIKVGFSPSCTVTTRVVLEISSWLSKATT